MKRTHRLLSFALASLLPVVFATSSAHAQSMTGFRAQPAAHPEPAVEREWYGHRTLLADALSLGGLLATAEAEQPVGAAFIGSYFLATPIIHIYNGKVGTGLVSLGLRGGFTLLAVSGDILNGNGTAVLGAAGLVAM